MALCTRLTRINHQDKSKLKPTKVLPETQTAKRICCAKDSQQ